VVADGRGPWSLKTELGTTIALFSVSVITCIVGFVMISAYVISIKAANKVSTVWTSFAVFVELGHIAIWIAIAVYYRAGKNEQDLWGWSCSSGAANIQENFQDVLNFSQVCNRGVSFKWPGGQS
jgi:hypothetical protein